MGKSRTGKGVSRQEVLFPLPMRGSEAVAENRF